MEEGIGPRPGALVPAVERHPALSRLLTALPKWPAIMFAAIVPLLLAPYFAPAPEPSAGLTTAQIGSPAIATAIPTPAPAPTIAVPSRAVAETSSSPRIAASNVRLPVAAVMPRVVDTVPPPMRKAGSADPAPSTDHFVVVDGDSGAIMFERNAYEPVAPASTTKVMTAIVGVERGNPSDQVKVDVDAGTMPGSSLMGLEPWFHVTFADLLYGLMLPSGNDAALAIARYVGGTEPAFVELMNEKAGWLGLRSTHFVNPHGLDTSDHYSSPFDLVVMARYAMQYPLFREVVGSHSYEVRSDNLDLVLPNVNPLLEYAGADGVKTGLTDSAGRALVGTAVRNGHRVYVAFMRSTDGAAADGALLLDWAFSSFDWPAASR